jgi:aminopeptidase-like protein
VGAGSEWCVKKPLQLETRLECIMRLAMKTRGLPYRELGFFEGFGNDERVYAWPQFDIPGVALQRYPFAEYHTSDDTPDIIQSQYLLQAVEIAESFVQILESDYIPKYPHQLPPWLTRHGLYYDSIDNPEQFQKFNSFLLYRINGKFSLVDLAADLNLNYHEVLSYLNRFVELGFVRKQEIHWAQPVITGIHK